MSTTELYVRHWFAHHALSRATPTLRAASRKWIEHAAEANVGFVEQLRQIALEALAQDDPAIIKRGLIALAVVAKREDLERIRPLQDAQDAGIAADARATVFDITRGAV